MEDSERSIIMAKECGIDLGLHVNFTERYTANSIPRKFLESQERLIKFLTASKYSFLLYNPFLKNHFRNVFESQYGEFIRAFGQPPSHIDGHQHMHLASNLLIDQIFPQGAKIRRNFSFHAGEKSFMNRSYRRAVDWWVSRNFLITDYFFALSQHMTITRLQKLIILAKIHDVELMTHPEIPDEFNFIMSDDYSHAVSQIKLGNYSML